MEIIKTLTEEILTSKGYIALPELKVGDLVKGCEPTSGKYYSLRVKGISTYQQKENNFWYVINGKYRFAPHQQVYADKQFFHAQNLKVGQKLLHENGTRIEIKTIEKVKDKCPKIKIHLEDVGGLFGLFKKNRPKTYFLDGVLVHNPTLYWYGNGGNWSDYTNHWSNNSGNSPASPAAAAPTSSDDVVIDGSSGTGTIAFDAAAYCANFDASLSTILAFSGSSALYVYGSFEIVTGVTWSVTGITYFKATSTGKTIKTNTTALGEITFDGVGGEWTLSDNLTLAGATNKNLIVTRGSFVTADKTLTLRYFASSNSNTRAVHLGSSTLNLESFTLDNSVGLDFDAGTSVIIQSAVASNFSGGGNTFYELQMLQPGDSNISGANTFTNLKRIGTASVSDGVNLSLDQIVTGTLTLRGNSAYERLLVRSQVLGAVKTITAAVVDIDNVDFQDITAAGVAHPFTGVSLGDCGGNTDITFDDAADQHWTDTNGGSWSDSGNWTSRTPLPQDNVFLDCAFGTSKTVTIDMPRLGKSVDFTGASWTTALTVALSVAPTLYGNLTLISGLTITTSSSTITLSGRGADQTLDTDGATITTPLTIASYNGTYTLKNDLTMSSTRLLTLSRGVFTCVDGATNYALSVGSVSVFGGTITLGSATHLLTGTGDVWSYVSGTVSASTGTIKITNTATSSVTFKGGSKTYNNLWFDRAGSTSNITITGNNIFADFKDTGTEAHSLLFTAASTQTVSSFTVSGSAGKLITLESTTATGHYHLIKSGGLYRVSCDYLDIQHSVATPANTWYAGANSHDDQADNEAGSGWVFTVPPALTGSLSDTITFAEAPVTSQGISKTLADTLVIAESGTFGSTAWTKALSDALSYTEELAKEAIKVTSDSLVLAESLANIGTLNVSDSISISEALARAWAVNRTLADTITFTEQITKSASKKVLSDEISITEALVSVKTFYLALSDSILITDSSNREIVLPLTDSIAITEAYTHLWTIKAAIADTLSFSESGVMEVGKKVADSQSIVESLANQTTGRITDTLGITESLDRIVEYHLELSDTETIVDALGKSPSFVLADSIGIVETVSVEPQPQLSDLVTFVETLANQSTMGLSDVLSIAEANVKRITKPNMFEAVNIVPTITTKHIVKIFTETVTIADSSGQELYREELLSDSVSITESLTFRVGKKLTSSFDLFDQITKRTVMHTLGDTLSITETLANQTTLSISDSIIFSESILAGGEFILNDIITFTESLKFVLHKTVSDSETISEALAKDIIKPFAESVNLASSMANVQVLSHSDAISITEAKTLLATFVRNLAESVSLAESQAKDIYKVLTDSVTFSDTEVEKEVRHFEDAATPFNETQVKTIVKVLTDTETIADSEGAVISLPLGDSLGITEALGTVTAFRPVLDDSVSFLAGMVWSAVAKKTENEPISENLANSYSLRLSDSVTFAESVLVVYIFPLTDSLTITEAIDHKDIIKRMTETLTIADSTSPTGQKYLTPADSVGITETSIRKPVKIFAETVTIVESLTPVTGKGFSETVTIVETSARVVEFHLTFSESIAISDSQVPLLTRPLTDSLGGISESMKIRYIINLSESVTLAEDFDTDKHPQERIGQMGFLRTRYM